MSDIQNWARRGRDARATPAYAGYPAEALLHAMDKAEADRAVIAPVDRCLAVHNREGNESHYSTLRMAAIGAESIK